MSSPPRARIRASWAVLLAGPIIGTAYFFVVYLLAEASCADGLDLLGTTALRVVIVSAAAGTVAVYAVTAWGARVLWKEADQDRSGQHQQNQRFMATTGLILLGLFILFVLFLAAPALGSSLC